MVEAKQRELFRANGVVQHELVLVVNAARLELVDVLIDAVRTSPRAGCSVVRRGDVGIDVIAEVLMHAPRIDVGR